MKIIFYKLVLYTIYIYKPKFIHIFSETLLLILMYYLIIRNKLYNNYDF